MRSLPGAWASFVLLLCCSCLIKCNSVNKQKDPSSCTLYEKVGANDLSLNDVVVEDKESKIVCIRARFSLAIRVQEPMAPLDGGNEKLRDEAGNEIVVDLGYLQLDQVKSIESTCPEMTAPAEGGEAQFPDELKMVVTFECAKLTFNFKREENYYLSSIKGTVTLGNNLTHHFKFNDLIEVNSSVRTDKLQLTANFYNTEIEAFRKTSSRAFIRQVDENSRPFATVDA